MLVLVTGATGFIGRHLVNALLAADHRASRLGAGSILPWFHTRVGIHPKIDWSRCDLCGECEKVCPVEAVVLSRRRLDYGLCGKARCLACIDACPIRAISANQMFSGK